MTDSLALLEARHSAPSRQLTEPGPDAATLRRLLSAAIRVPDHGKRVPYRLITLQGAARQVFGERVAERAIERTPDLSDSKIDKERRRYGYAPLVVVVVARVEEGGKIPAIEQHHSAGCVAYNLLLGCTALGLGAQWLTGWAAYDPGVAILLGLGQDEHVTGFVHIGSVDMDIPDRDRPALDELLTEWTP